MTSLSQDGTIAFLVTSHSRTEEYIPLVGNLLDTFWSEHPPRYFLTDGVSQASGNVLSFPGLTWIALFSAGLGRIKRERPQTRYVFHMLEDHCPLRPCDGNRLDRIFEIAAGNDLDAVSFPTYPWPWNETVRVGRGFNVARGTRARGNGRLPRFTAQVWAHLSWLLRSGLMIIIRFPRIGFGSPPVRSDSIAHTEDGNGPGHIRPRSLLLGAPK